MQLQTVGENPHLRTYFFTLLQYLNNLIKIFLTLKHSMAYQRPKSKSKSCPPSQGGHTLLSQPPQNLHKPNPYSLLVFLKLKIFFFFFFFFFFFVFRTIPAAYGGSQGRELELLAYTIATTPPDPSRICNLHHSAHQLRILNPLSKARGRTYVLKDASQIHFH